MPSLQRTYVMALASTLTCSSVWVVLSLPRGKRGGWAVDDLLAGAGFALIAYGASINGFGRPVDANGEALPVDRRGRVATLAGMALVVAGLVLEAGARG